MVICFHFRTFLGRIWKQLMRQVITRCSKYWESWKKFTGNLQWQKSYILYWKCVLLRDISCTLQKKSDSNCGSSEESLTSVVLGGSKENFTHTVKHNDTGVTLGSKRFWTSLRINLPPKRSTDVTAATWNSFENSKTNWRLKQLCLSNKNNTKRSV